ncbi:MAG: hypothetical protein ACTSVL_08120 [Promethearchaeota archaeon]
MKTTLENFKPMKAFLDNINPEFAKNIVLSDLLDETGHHYNVRLILDSGNEAQHYYIMAKNFLRLFSMIAPSRTIHQFGHAFGKFTRLLPGGKTKVGWFTPDFIGYITDKVLWITEFLGYDELSRSDTIYGPNKELEALEFLANGFAPIYVSWGRSKYYKNLANDPKNPIGNTVPLLTNNQHIKLIEAINKMMEIGGLNNPASTAHFSLQGILYEINAHRDIYGFDKVQAKELFDAFGIEKIKYDGSNYEIQEFTSGKKMEPWWDNWQNIHQIGNLDEIIQKLTQIYHQLLATGELIV